MAVKLRRWVSLAINVPQQGLGPGVRALREGARLWLTSTFRERATRDRHGGANSSLVPKQGSTEWVWP